MRFSILHLIVILVAWPAIAHDAGLSTATVKLSQHELSYSALFSPMDGIDDQSKSAIVLVQADGAILQPIDSSLFKTANEEFKLRLRFPRPAMNSSLQLKYLARLGTGHLHFVTVQNNGEETDYLVEGAKAAIAIPGASLVQSPGPPAPQLNFLTLGMQHVLIGYDHLAFLFCLLIVGGSLWKKLHTISAFTVAHSVSLALAVSGTVQFDPAFVELAIALSIVLAGVANLLFNSEIRWPIAFALGLIHGLGFASVLGELPSSQGGFLLRLFHFNVGIECAQLSLAALFLPLWFFICRNQVREKICFRVASTAVILLGAYWAIERV